MATKKVLIVCLANTCRSPACADILRHLAKSHGRAMEVDSCAVTGWSIGEPPNPRMSEILESRGIAVTHARRARRIQPHDFEQFDVILGVTKDVVKQLQGLAANPQQAQKVKMLGDFSSKFTGEDIPDPFERDDLCEHVVNLMTDACRGFLQ